MTSSRLVSSVIWGMKLGVSKTKTMIVSRSCITHPHTPALTIDETVLKESDDLVILAVTFDSKMTFEKHLRSVSRAASQRPSKKKVKSSMARSFPVENLLPQNVGSIINYLQ